MLSVVFHHRRIYKLFDLIGIEQVESSRLLVLYPSDTSDTAWPLAWPKGHRGIRLRARARLHGAWFLCQSDTGTLPFVLDPTSP